MLCSGAYSHKKILRIVVFVAQKRREKVSKINWYLQSWQALTRTHTCERCCGPYIYFHRLARRHLSIQCKSEVLPCKKKVGLEKAAGGEEPHKRTWAKRRCL